VNCKRARLYYFTDTVDFKEKQKVPHSYSRAEENARFANGVRDDETEKDYINLEIAPRAPCLRNPRIVSNRFLNATVWNEPHDGHQRITKTCEQRPQKRQRYGDNVNDHRHSSLAVGAN
jgi:hypothetical protein